ncbi:hypothetical protein MPTK1_2g06050 [Marchantia polymorpha subsp. ruderalis]|uniref:Small acidic protein-like domain-containing protein n=2 Tax=Marchantia polymorpha TaxID=3197 RepID=A0A176VQD5_MARPO|nr:hypothetical protein AXG93_3986s1050 [Marchantia polymorpha subsp. ruderalis]PTQ44194.1 hypothetical protein MARPO_0021s0060 [Marchantia polymorpha]PTQ44195.1 hypothetical protein MARPO_0021s0060 [Marchantia polymorpha]PTQ44196.1 hypothetical protein MARPO_0021s0060 [Marchantia polymorpha]BBN01269.1 hypothetical protein Mp_2g06050 [Marchantia polymorpha subsp. ruderalis]|eukprot:PTQ44194.1 hypothetical protein MARPO_0021s0060 [Marchantia polymorpha]
MDDEQNSYCSETESVKFTAHSPPSSAREDSGWNEELGGSSVQVFATERTNNQTTYIMKAATEEESTGTVSSLDSSSKKKGTSSVTQKRKLLWPRKSDRDQQDPVNVARGNRWEKAYFSDAYRQRKFLKLMGVRQFPAARCNEQDIDSDVLSDKAQRTLYQDLENQFAISLKRGSGQTTGLGL